MTFNYPLCPDMGISVNSAYSKYGCRCEACLEGQRIKESRKRQRRREERGTIADKTVTGRLRTDARRKLDGVKRCGRCREEKPVGAFSRMSSANDGLQSYCRECISEYGRRWRAQNPRAKRERKSKPEKQYGLVGEVTYMVYAMGRYKIGKTTDLSRRITEIGTGCPVEPTVAASCSAEHLSEEELHARFDNHRTWREWFALPAMEAGALVWEMNNLSLEPADLTDEEVYALTDEGVDEALVRSISCPTCGAACPCCVGRLDSVNASGAGQEGATGSLPVKASAAFVTNTQGDTYDMRGIL